MNDLDMDRFYAQFDRMRPGTGTIKNEGKKLKPNETCPCGSGKKYKKCCQHRLESMARRRRSNTIYEDELDKSNAK